MEKSEIAARAIKMKTNKDFLSLLNRIKKDEMVRNGFADKFHPFTMKLLNYYCNPNNVFHRYRTFKIRKKSGGFRSITSPRNRSFMLMLNYVNLILNSLYQPSEYAMGFAEGKSIVDNAKKHTNKKYVFNIDLKDFFPSIERARVWKRLELAPFNFPNEIAGLIAGLCCMKINAQIDAELFDKLKDRKYSVGKDNLYVLPQGAPTSPTITNMICDKLDHRLAGVAYRFGLDYSRYADDITFSSMHSVFSPNGEFRTELRRVINDQGFTINPQKTRLEKVGARQEVTGLTVSNKVNVPRKYTRDIRNVLYMWDRYGYTDAYMHFLPKYKAEKGHVKKGNPDLINVIDGKLMYLKMVKGESDPVYIRLYTKFISLIKNDEQTSQDSARGVTYLDPMPLTEFERKYKVNLEIKYSENGHRYAIYKLNNRTQRVSVNKTVTPEMEKDKNSLSISMCVNAKRERFYLLFSKEKNISNAVPVKTVATGKNDIDALNTELDALLDDHNG